MKRNLYVGCALALLCTACLSSSDDTDGTDGTDAGQSFASTGILQQMLVGRTTFGNYLVDGSFSNAFCDYYAADGTISSVELIGDGREGLAGTYSLEDDQLCVTYPQRGGEPVCRSVVAKQSSSNPNVWGGDVYGPDGIVQSHIITTEGNQVDRCH